MLTESMLAIATQHKDDLPLSHTQRQFNRLIKQIELEQKKLIAWKNIIPLFQQKYLEEYAPLLEKSCELKIDLIKLLDHAYEDGSFGKIIRLKIRRYICLMLHDVAEFVEEYELKNIYNKHTKEDYDKKAEEEKQTLKFILKNNYGFDLGDDFDLNSPAQIMEKLAHLMNKQREQGQRKAQKKKSTKAQAKEQKLKEEELEANRSIKEVYRKLAAQLHPDKEQDLLEYDRKNELMQRVNLAYENNDLLQLLALQLETEQINQNTLNNLSTARLHTYIRILKEQLKALLAEIKNIELSFKLRFELNFENTLKPALLLDQLQHDIEYMQAIVASRTHDLDSLKDNKKLKIWFKNK
jgi:hypothetical protein